MHDVDGLSSEQVVHSLKKLHNGRSLAGDRYGQLVWEEEWR